MLTSHFFLCRVNVFSRQRAYYDCRRSPIQTAYIVKNLNGLAKTRILIIDDKKSIRYAVTAAANVLRYYDMHFAEDGVIGIE